MRAGGSTSTSYPASAYALAGANLLMVWPTPSGADVITIYQTPRPTALSVSSDDPSTASLGGIATEYHKAIEWYMSWQAADSEDAEDKGDHYRQLYEQTLTRIRATSVRKGGRLGRAQIGPLRPNSRGNARNDLYPR